MGEALHKLSPVFHFLRQTRLFLATGLTAWALQLHATESSRALFTRVWRSHEGLPGNEVTGLAQDGSGYLWITHLNGLAKFDGVRFQNVPLPLPSERGFTIRRLLRVSGDRFWLAMDRGIVVFVSPERTNVLTSADGLSDASPLSIAESRDGAIWIGYSDSTACRIVGQRVTRFGAQEGLAPTGSCRLATDLEGRVWFAQAGRAGIWDHDRFQTLVTLPEQHVRIARALGGGVWLCAGSRVLSYRLGEPLIEQAQLPFERESAIPELLLEDRSGAVWVGTFGSGLYRCRGTNVEPVQTSQRTILSLYEDREASIWVGTAGGGLNRLRPRVLDLQDMEGGLPFETARTVCVDSTGRVWAVGRNGALAYQEAGSWRLCGADDGWSEEVATCLAADAQGDVWIGVQRSGAIYRWHRGTFSRLDRSDGLAGDTVRILLASQTGALWVGLLAPNCLQRFKDGKFQTFQLPPGSQAISAAAEDGAGNLWLGTGDGLLWRVTGNQLVDETRRAFQPGRTITCLRATPEGSLWIGYLGAGLGRLRPEGFALIEPQPGLPIGSICNLMPDRYGAIWLSTDQGILRVSQAALEQVAEGQVAQVNAIYFASDELLDLQGFPFFPSEAAESQDGNLLFPQLTGLAVVHPERVATNWNPPLVLIETATADDRPLALPQQGGVVQLGPGLRKLEFQFTAPSFIAPESIRFRHQLEGVDEDWVDLGTQRRVTYTRLPPGKYLYRVTACNYAGVWNDVGAQVHFQVRPFFWQTPLLKVAAGLFLLLGLGGVVRYLATRRLRQELRHARQEAALERERARIAKDIHDDLGASLTQISLLSELATRNLPPTDAMGEHVRKLAQTARQAFGSLDEIVWAVNPRNDTLANLLDYLAQFALDFLSSTHVRCRLDFPAQPPAQPVSAEARHTLYLILKEALNNVIKHAQASEVRLRARLVDDSLQLTIEDDGVGFENPGRRPEADGLLNMRQRLEEIGGTFKLDGDANPGTVIVVAVPLARPRASAAPGAQAPTRNE